MHFQTRLLHFFKKEKIICFAAVPIHHLSSKWRRTILRPPPSCSFCLSFPAAKGPVKRATKGPLPSRVFPEEKTGVINSSTFFSFLRRARKMSILFCGETDLFTAGKKEKKQHLHFPRSVVFLWVEVKMYFLYYVVHLHCTRRKMSE